MTGFISTHSFKNGAVVTVEAIQGEVAIRIQDEEEKMLCDLIVGRYEAMCIAHSLLSVLTNPSKQEGL